MEMEKRILQIFGKLDRNGAETMIMNLYRHIDRDKIQFDFIVHTEDKGDYEDEILQMGGRIYRCPRYRGINHYQYIKWWIEFFKNYPYKVIHSHIRSTASLYIPIYHKIVGGGMR